MLVLSSETTAAAAAFVPASIASSCCATRQQRCGNVFASDTGFVRVSKSWDSAWHARPKAVKTELA